MKNAGDATIGTTIGDTTIGRITGDTTIGRITSDEKTTTMWRIAGDAAIGRTTGDATIGRITGDTTIGRITGDTAIRRTIGDETIGRTRGERKTDAEKINNRNKENAFSIISVWLFMDFRFVWWSLWKCYVLSAGEVLGHCLRCVFTITKRAFSKCFCKFSLLIGPLGWHLKKWNVKHLDLQSTTLRL